MVVWQIPDFSQLRKAKRILTHLQLDYIEYAEVNEKFTEAVKVIDELAALLMRDFNKAIKNREDKKFVL